MAEKKPRSKVRVQDVARAAGLSNATVSRVLHGSEGVRPNLHERVIKTALNLGFDLNRSNDSRIVAFLLSNRGVLHPFHSAVLVGAEAHCAANDFGVLFLPLQYSSQASLEGASHPPAPPESQDCSRGHRRGHELPEPPRRTDGPATAHRLPGQQHCGRLAQLINTVPCFLMTLAAPRKQQVTCSL